MFIFISLIFCMSFTPFQANIHTTHSVGMLTVTDITPELPGPDSNRRYTVLYLTSLKCSSFTPHFHDFRSSFNVCLSLLTLQHSSPICFALQSRLSAQPAVPVAAFHTNADQTSPSSIRVHVEQKQASLVHLFFFICHTSVKVT